MLFNNSNISKMSIIRARVTKSINNSYATKNVVYWDSLDKHDEHFMQFIDKNNKKYVKLAKKLGSDDISSHTESELEFLKLGVWYIYLNNEDRTILDLTLNQYVMVPIVPKPEIATTLFVSITDKTKINQINNVTDAIENTIKTVLINTVVNANTTHAFFVSERYYADFTMIIGKNNAELDNAYIDSTTQIIIVNTDKKTLHFNLSSINFEQIGVGGLEKEFTVMKNICKCMHLHIFSNVLRSKISYAQHRKAS